MLSFGPKIPDREDAAAPTRPRVSLYAEPRDVWIGVYVAPSAIYVCPLPCMVIRWQRGPKTEPVSTTDPWA